MGAEDVGQSSGPAMRPCPFAIAAMTVPARRWETRADLMVQIARAERFMRESPVGEVSVPEAAAVAGLSLHHFIRLFHEIYSLSPRAFLARLQFQRAKVLLNECNWSVLAVAAEIGFENASAFSRFFKTHSGCTPTEYRRRIKSEI